MHAKSVRHIDINCDLGEGATVADCYRDAKIMPYISRCNIACGGHAGNEEIMRRTLQCAQQYSVFAGAHPSYPDRENFGRQTMDIEFDSLADSLCRQIDLLKTIADECQVKLTHIKLHGALYNDAESDRGLARRLVTLFHQRYPRLDLLVLAKGEMQLAAEEKQVSYIKEGFMDRAYRANGRLMARSQPGAVYENSDQAIAQALLLAKRQPLLLANDFELPLQVDSICLHGDRPDAQLIARQVFFKLQHAGIEVA